MPACAAQAHVVLAVLVCVLAQWQPIFKVWYTLGCGLLVVFVMLLLQWNWLGGNWVLVA